MARLPKDYVKGPKFDNPLRPTVTPDLAVVGPPPIAVEAPKEEKPEKPKRSKSRSVEPKNSEVKTASSPDTQDELKHRFTARVTDAQWRGLQTELFQRKLAGEKIATADLVREILDKWLAGQL